MVENLSTPGGISEYRLDFKAMVGNPSKQVRFLTYWSEIRPRGLVDLDVAVSSVYAFQICSIGSVSELLNKEELCGGATDDYYYTHQGINLTYTVEF